MEHVDLKFFLDEKSEFYNTSSFISEDPVCIPHLFKSNNDIEISGFLTATIAWGKRQQIIRSAKELMRRMDYDIHNFIISASDNEIRKVSKDYVYRTFNESDCYYFLKATQNIYLNEGGFEKVFTSYFKKFEGDSGLAISKFRELFFSYNPMVRTYKHVSSPVKNSSSKRICMYLRWMVRRDTNGVDFGLWKGISPANLCCPLDVHTGRVSRKLGILTRKQNDWKAVNELTNNLLLFDKNDPVKYDFALFGLGLFEKF